MLFPFLSCVSTVILVWIIWSPLILVISFCIVCYFRFYRVFLPWFLCESFEVHCVLVISFCIVCYFRFYRVFLPWFLCESFEVHWFLSLVFVLYAISVFIVCFYRDSCVNHFKSTDSFISFCIVCYFRFYRVFLPWFLCESFEVHWFLSLVFPLILVISIVCYFRFYRVFLPWFLCESFEVHWFLSLVFVLYAISVFIVCFYRDSCVNHFKSTDSCH